MKSVIVTFHDCRDCPFRYEAGTDDFWCSKLDKPMADLTYDSDDQPFPNECPLKDEK